MCPALFKINKYIFLKSDQFCWRKCLPVVVGSNEFVSLLLTPRAAESFTVPSTRLEKKEKKKVKIRGKTVVNHNDENIAQPYVESLEFVLAI